jgi:hypothetical protein
MPVVERPQVVAVGAAPRRREMRGLVLPELRVGHFDTTQMSLSHVVLAARHTLVTAPPSPKW